MESKAFKDEMKDLLIRDISPNEALEIAGRLYQDERVKDRSERLGHPVDECVKVYAGITGVEHVDPDAFVAFLDAALDVALEVATDEDLRSHYLELQPVDRAAPIAEIWEIASLILVAVMSGAASGTAATLIRRFFSGHRKQERADLLARFLLDSPVPALLSGCPDGLSVEEMTASSGLQEAVVGVHLGRLEGRGWVEREERDNMVIWRLRKRKLLKDFRG